MVTQAKYTYQNIADRLRQHILSHPTLAGSQLPPEPQLAQDYGVSRITLRKALDILHDEHLVVRQKGRGTFVAEIIEDTVSQTVVYIGRADGHFWRELYLAVVTEVQAQGYNLSTILENRLGQASQRAGIAEEVAGARAVICTSECYGELMNLKLNLPRSPIVIGKWLDTMTTASSIACDPREAVQMATTWLLGQGHRHIVFAGSTPGGQVIPGVSLPHSRSEGLSSYAAAYAAAGLPFDRRYALALSHDDAGLAMLNRLYDALPDKPTAFVCDADFRSVPVYRMARERNLRIPEDVSIIAVGNTPWCEMLDPPLSSVSLDESATARAAVGLLSLNDERPLHLRVRPLLVHRRTTSTSPTVVPQT